MKYDITVLKRKMLVKYPFFGSVVASVDYKENEDIPTAGTDGETIYYNPKYLESLSVEEQTFIFAHEVCHIAFNHILRSEGKDPELWNIATDGVINQFLKRDGLKMTLGGVDMAEAINYDAEQLYDKLLQEKQQRQQQNGQGNSQSEQGNHQQNQQQSSGSSQGENGQQQSQSQQQTGDSQNQEDQKQDSKAGQSGDEQQQSQQQNSSNSGNSQKEDKSKQDVGHDTHSMWEQAVKKHKKQQEKTDKKESLLDKLLGKNKNKKDKEETELEKKQEELESMGEKDAFKKNLEIKKKQLEDLKEEISKEASQAGISTNRDIRTVNDIGTAKPLIDWRYILKESIMYDVDWSYKNATLEDGVVSANLEEQPMPETEIVLDTSGSVNEVLLNNFLRECKNILQHTKLKVGCFDTEFYGFHEIRTEEDIENMRFEGGGGTDFDVAVGAFSRRVLNKIIFTDGEAPMPVMSLDATWIVFGSNRINPLGGSVFYIDNVTLKKLNNSETTSKSKKRIKN